ncbi:GNAT family N-acetyltransferase [Geomonas azotofigens]|uniref:GNAT family N-acetyltransferase n=1 Tax=Geomonas azotofigens TaxID=2843196 RepID=UPI001C12019F|nr:GNAT family N-acetyltransferase [Geomonas azotofigens]MBU5613389.1 GNAT family N-acetyltransferase [Geomonas azotofigens]
MSTDDVPGVVQVHLSSFPGFFLSFLGPRFLGIFYRGIREDESGIGYVYLNPAGEPAGFVAGTVNPRGFYKRLLKRDWLRFSLASLGPIARRPAAAGRIVRALLHPGQNPVGDSVAGLFSIGVLPELQGTGAGKLLVRAFLDEAAARGCRSVFLTTDRDGNDAVNLFYQKLGFTLERQYVTPQGRRMNEYWISLAPQGV